MWCCLIRRPVKGKKCNLPCCDWLNLVVDVEGRWILLRVFSDFFLFSDFLSGILVTSYVKEHGVVLRSMSFGSLLWVVIS